MNLGVTGYIDTITHKHITLLRCGEADFTKDIYASKNYGKDVNSRSTNRTDYTFMVDSWSSFESIHRQNLTIRNAFYYWRNVVSKTLHLHWSENNPDFIISFVNSK